MGKRKIEWCDEKYRTKVSSGRWEYLNKIDSHKILIIGIQRKSTGERIVFKNPIEVIF